MVSAGDKDISLHIPRGGGRVYSGQVKTEKSLKCQDLHKCQFGGGGILGKSKLKSP